jgi:SAM-dependent methyltransferase
MQVANDWWRTFFTDLAVELWLLVPTEEQTRQEADFIESHLKVGPGAHILDAPCGGGRHAHCLAKRGYEVTAVDLSADFLKAARARPVEGPGKVTFLERDMRDLGGIGPFDGAYCFGNSFGYFDDVGNAAFLSAVAGALKPGGRFILDTGNVAESILPDFQPRGWMKIGDMLFLAEREFDVEKSRINSEYTFIKDGRVVKQAAFQRTHSVHELIGMLKNAGFDDHKCLGTLQGERFGLGSKRLLMVATRMGA